jgi:CheY-like chemotaxis protein
MEQDGTGATGEQVREALLNLYRPAALARCALGRFLDDRQRAAPAAERAEALRNLLLDLIEELRPKAGGVLPASASRAHECMRLRYVSGLPVDEVAEELSLGPRQVYRDLRWAEERLAELITIRYRQARAGTQPDVVEREALELAVQPEEVSLAQIVQWAVTTLSPLAARQQCSLRYAGPTAGIIIRATPGVVREVIVQVVSALIQNSPGGQVEVEAFSAGKAATVQLSAGPPQQFCRRDLLDSALRIAQTYGMSYEAEQNATAYSLRLRWPLARYYHLLVVEDNRGATTLYERYLADTEWEMHVAADPRLAVDLARSKHADAVLLDVMMPQTDGWTVLQALKLDPDTASIPVVICSVVDDPELGLALGAAAYLTKPVTRPGLLEALQRALGKHRPASAAPGSS